MQGQSLLFTQRIQVTDTIEDEGVFIAVSSDDAEQINQEIDALYDDDLDAGWEGAPEDQNVVSVGLRFRSIAIPAGATIDSAYLLIHAHEGKSKEDVARITIAGINQDNPETFDEVNLVDARPKTSAHVLWVVDDAWEIWEPYRSPDIAAVVQEIVNRPGWNINQSMGFMMLGENQGASDYEHAREFESFENISDPEDGGDGQNHPERVPQLVVYYSVSSGFAGIRIQVTDTIEDEGVMIAVSSDDAEQINSEIDALYDDDLDAGWEGAPEDQNVLTTGLRFRNIPVPHGARIDSAFLVIHAHEGKSSEDVARITISGEDTDNAITFDEVSLIDTRPHTTASVFWEVDDEWEIWEPYRTPNIGAVIQEIIDRDGWNTGNALVLMLLGENQGASDFENAREFESFENIADPEDGGDGQNHPERVPELLIYFSSPNSSGILNIRPDVKQLIVYPNPVHDGSCIVQLEKPEVPARITVRDMHGHVLYQMDSQGVPEVNVPMRLSAGYYLIQASQGTDLFAQKVIVH